MCTPDCKLWCCGCFVDRFRTPGMILNMNREPEVLYTSSLTTRPIPSSTFESKISLSQFVPGPSKSKSKENPNLPEAPFSIVDEILPPGMASPLKAIQGCPPGLEHLYHAGQFYVQHCRSMHSIDDLLKYDSRDRYQVLNKDGDRIYYAVGESDCWRWSLSGARPFRLKILDHRGDLVLSFKRPWTFGLFWFGGECMGNVVEVRHRSGSLLGWVQQKLGCVCPIYEVRNNISNRLLYARGPPIACCPFLCLRYYAKFLLYCPDSSESGSPAGKFVEFPFGISPDNLSNAISLTFPDTLEVETKASVLALLFCIYFMYFEVTDVIPGSSAVRDSNSVTGNRVSYWTDPNRVPFKRPKAGDVPGKCYPCKIVIIFSLIFLLTLFILWVTNDFIFNFSSTRTK